MQLFQACRRAWYLRNYRRLRPMKEPRVGALPFGSRVHSALEAWGDGTVGSPEVAWDALMAHEYAIAAETGSYVEDLDKESRLGRAMLEGYREWAEQEGIEADWEVVGVEVPLTDLLTLAVGTDGAPVVQVRVRGKLDRQIRRRSDGSRWVDDWKTAGNFGESTLISLERTPQLRLYMLLQRANLPEDVWVAGGVLTLLRKVLRTRTSKPPYYKRMVIGVNEHELDEYRIRTGAIAQQMLDVSTALDAGVDHRVAAPFTPSWQCQTCPFRHPCDLMRHTSEAAAEDILADLYVQADPLERYGHVEDDDA